MDNETEKALRELVEASVMACDPVPHENASCHVGITTQDKCAHCSRLIRLHEAIKQAEEVLSWIS